MDNNILFDNNLQENKTEKLRREMDKQISSLNYEKAIVQCKKILFFTPDDAELYLIMSSLYLKLYDLSSSISCLKKALMLCPQEPQIQFKTTNAFFCKGLIEYEQNENIQCDTNVFCEIRMEMKPTHFYYLRAKAFLMLDKLPETIRELNKVLLIDNENEHALIFLGKILIKTGKVKEGERLFWKANEINPLNEDVKQFVFMMKQKMDIVLKETNENILKGRFKHAMLLSSKALNIFPNHPEALLLRSSINRSMGKLHESISDLSKAKYYAGIGEMSGLIQTYISNIYNELSSQKLLDNDIPTALGYIEESLKNNPNDIIAHLNKGDCYMRLKDIMNAKNEYLTCLDINPTSINAKIRIAQVFYKLAILSYNSKDYEDAYDYLNLAVDYYQRSDAIYVLRARTNLKLNQIKHAYTDAQLAYAINPKNQDAIEIKKYLA